MIDPIAQAMQAVTIGSPSALALMFVAGVVSSVGPCAAPRLIAIAGVTAHRDPAWIRRSTLAFIAGLVGAYASFGIFATSIGSVAALSPYAYALLALGLACGGILTLRKKSWPVCQTGRLTHRGCDTLGGSFLLGGSFALVISPCCAPIIAATLAYCVQIHSAGYAASLLAVFALGHALPILAFAGSVSALSTFVIRFRLDEALHVTGGVLMLALAGYYLCLA